MERIELELKQIDWKEVNVTVKIWDKYCFPYIRKGNLSINLITQRGEIRDFKSVETLLNFLKKQGVKREQIDFEIGECFWKEQP